MDFIQAYTALQLKTPRVGSIRLNAINSEYTHNTDQCKNCYLLCNAVKNEDCMYGRDFYENADCIDCDHIFRCTLCYQCLNSKECYNSTYLQDCANCLDCDYGYDLKDCKNCIGCVGLRKKEFHIFNKPYSPEEYRKEKMRLTPEVIMREFEALKPTVPRVATHQLNTDHCIGDYLQNCKNAFACFDSSGCQDVGYVSESKSVKDSWDIFTLEESELCYECSSNHILTNCNFCFMCVSSSNLEYCELVFNSKNCFGCIGLNHKEYYILNQPYVRDEYFKKIAEIKDFLKKQNLYGRWYPPPTYPQEDTVAVWPRL